MRHSNQTVSMMVRGFPAVKWRSCKPFVVDAAHQQCGIELNGPDRKQALIFEETRVKIVND